MEKMTAYEYVFSVLLRNAPKRSSLRTWPRSFLPKREDIVTSSVIL